MLSSECKDQIVVQFLGGLCWSLGAGARGQYRLMAPWTGQKEMPVAPRDMGLLQTESPASFVARACFHVRLFQGRDL